MHAFQAKGICRKAKCHVSFAWAPNLIAQSQFPLSSFCFYSIHPRAHYRSAIFLAITWFSHSFRLLFKVVLSFYFFIYCQILLFVSFSWKPSLHFPFFYVFHFLFDGKCNRFSIYTDRSDLNTSNGRANFVSAGEFELASEDSAMCNLLIWLVCTVQVTAMMRYRHWKRKRPCGSWSHQGEPCSTVFSHQRKVALTKLDRTVVVWASTSVATLLPFPFSVVKRLFAEFPAQLSLATGLLP